MYSKKYFVGNMFDTILIKEKKVLLNLAHTCIGSDTHGKHHQTLWKYI